MAEVRELAKDPEVIAINDRKETNTCDKSIDDLFKDDTFIELKKTELKGKHIENLRTSQRDSGS